MIASTRRRHAVSLVETLVAIAILAVAGVGILISSRGETTGVIHTAERYTAELLLGELEAVFGGGSLEYYQSRGFPAPPAEGAPDPFSELQRSLFDDHPAMVGRSAPLEGTPTAVGDSLRASIVKMKVTRSIYVRELTTGAGLRAGVVTFRVSYQDRADQPRTLERHQVVYPARLNP